MISIKLKGTEELKKLDVEMISKNYMKSLVKTIQDDITKNITDERVVSENIGGSYGAPKPLTQNYLNWKIRHGKPKNIFRKDLNLIKSIKAKKNSEFNYTIYVSGKANNYAEYVNEPRKFFGISKTIIEQIEKSFKMLKVA